MDCGIARCPCPPPGSCVAETVIPRKVRDKLDVVPVRLIAYDRLGMEFNGKRAKYAQDIEKVEYGSSNV